MIVSFGRAACAALVLSILLLSCGNASREQATTTTRAAANTAAEQTDVSAYRDWVIQQGDAFLVATQDFTAAILAGNRQKAQKLYAPARQYYERIEPIAEALGDFDPHIDARAGDVPAADWRGYHKLEQILWSGADIAGAKLYAATLLEDTKLLRAKLETVEITVNAMIAGSVELLNEVSTKKVTGEEDRYSHTDLWDIEANVQGSEKIYQILRVEADKVNPQLVQTLDQRFKEVLTELSLHRVGDGFKYYQELKPEEVKKLSQLIDALGEPLAQLGKIFKQV